MKKTQADGIRERIKFVLEKLGPDALTLPDLRVQLSRLEKAGRPLSECWNDLTPQ
jgi:hypothetical protein